MLLVMCAALSAYSAVRPDRLFGLPVSVFPPSAAAECLQPQRSIVKPLRLTSPHLFPVNPAPYRQNSPAHRQAALLAACCDLPVVRYSVLAKGRDDKFSFTPQLHSRNSIMPDPNKQTLATEE
jgi:hypothetical protein